MLMSSNDRPATLHYGPNGFRVLSPGSHVVCAVTGEKIALFGSLLLFLFFGGAIYLDWKKRKANPDLVA